MIYPYARRMSAIKASEIRELLKLTEKPEIISFAGGLPAPELFPIEEIKTAHDQVMDACGEKALQYAATEGFQPLRQWIATRMNIKLGTSFSEDDIMITHGSQQALDLTGKVFLDKDDIVLCESPTYLAAINAFKSYECKFGEVQTDDHGMLVDDLERALETTKRTKLIYMIPDFQNPSGRTWSLERRRLLAEVSARYNVMVLEDNPYSELRFEGTDLPAVKSFDTSGNIICTGTFSKIFCPGYRIGWVAGCRDVVTKYVLAKQGADLQCNTIAQMVIAKYLELYDIDRHIETIRETYRRRRNLAIQCIKNDFPPGVKYTHPEGGLFLWLELPNDIDSVNVFKKCLECNVSFVPGRSFFPNGGVDNTLRLNFSNMSEERICEGMKRIARVLEEMLDLLPKRGTI